VFLWFCRNSGYIMDAKIVKLQSVFIKESVSVVSGQWSAVSGQRSAKAGFHFPTQYSMLCLPKKLDTDCTLNSIIYVNEKKA
jgi:hypothetical protein